MLRKSQFAWLAAMLLAGLSYSAAWGQTPASAPIPLAQDPKSSVVLPDQTAPVKPIIELPKAELTVPQLLVFTGNQLGNIGQAAKLNYSFSHSSTDDQPFTDTITMEVSAPNPDGTHDTSFKFLTAEHEIHYPALAHFGGNPLIMLFLERDTGEMHRLTGGAELFFRNRIRAGFAEPGVALEAVQVPYEGHTIDAIRVTIAPYTAPKYKDHLKQYTGKQYSVILSGIVPGGVYQVRAITPGTGDAKPLSDDIMTYQGQTQLADAAVTPAKETTP